MNKIVAATTGSESVNKIVPGEQNRRQTEEEKLHVIGKKVFYYKAERQEDERFKINQRWRFQGYFNLKKFAISMEPAYWSHGLSNEQDSVREISRSYISRLSF